MDKKIGVIGAGLMGAEIALVFALGGYNVVLIDLEEAKLNAAMDRLRTLLEKGVSRELYTADQVGQTMARIQTDTDISGCADADMVTEAVFESLDVKSDVLRRLDGVCKPDCLLVTNTSTIPISTLASALPPTRRPHFIGMHYFSPVSRMKLVEVIPGFETSDETFAQAWQLALDAGKTPVRVKDVAGFAVNRVLHAFIIEAIRLVDEGVATPEDIDTACRLGLGHPLGPFELLDRVTSSLTLQAHEIMHEAYGERFRPPALLKQRVQAGYVGGKGNKGWRS